MPKAAKAPKVTVDGADKPKRAKPKTTSRVMKAALGEKVLVDKLVLKRNTKVTLDYSGKGELAIKEVSFEGGTLCIVGKVVTARLSV